MKSMPTARCMSLFVIAFVCFQALAMDPALPQTGRPGGNGGVYTSEEYRFSIIPPKGFVALSEEQIKSKVEAARKKDKIPGQGEDGTAAPPIMHTIFQPSGFDPSMRSLVIIPGYPPWKSIEEFEKNVTPDTGNFVYHDRKTLNINGRNCFLLDREYDFQDMRIRQYCAFVSDYIPQGYLLTLSAAGVDFDEYADGFMTSLKSFKITPPEMPKELREKKYTGRKKEKSASWRSPEVILSLIFVAVFVIWFLVKRLSAGVEDEEDEQEEDGDDVSTTTPGKPPPTGVG